ncbi:hypothetical protein V1264_004763 [Littorina saxatilis]|uniref:HTH CENPB-type domain-containing protein n=1 Tax=Littorina saxatilis TaxID=31220 RepID=A0AAN9B2V1_9CAEN
MASTKKRKYLTLENRVTVVNRHKKGETAIAIAKSLDVGKSQIQRIIQDKENILKRWESGDNADRMRSKRQKSTYSDVNEKVWDWFLAARKKNFPITGRLIQEKALMLSVELGHDNFVASNGWLDRWLKRNNVKNACLSGDRGEVNEEVVEDWKKRLPTLCDGYEPCDIFNADESGFFYRALPNKSMVEKGDDRAGVKTSKDRVTVLFAVSAAGEKLKPLLIGRSAKPRCFQGQDVGTLGVDYHHNKRAWMTAAMFTQWANKLNNKMRIQKRKILVFVDNCSAHPPLSLSNVQFKFLPPNTTSKLQPCDAGVIQTVKLIYRKQLLRHLLFLMEEDSTATGPEIAKTINLLDAVLWLKKAWTSLQAETIQKCFLKCGFSLARGEGDLSAAPDSDQVTEQVDLDVGEQRLLGDMTIEEFCAMDDDLQVAADFELDTPSTSQTAEDEDTALDDDEDDEQMEEETIDFKTASSYAQKLTLFALKHAPELVDTIDNVKHDIEAVCLRKRSSATQTTLFSFLKKI